jgi:hypothetical protein
LEIEIVTKSKTSKEFLFEVARFYVDQLKLNNSKYKLVIFTDPSLKDSGNNGLCAKVGPKTIGVSLYSRLGMVQTLCTLAHEMVHVKQIARGQYKQTFNKGKVQHYWLGKRVVAKYIKRPWEIEAFSKQNILVETLSEYITKHNNNKKK